MSYTGTLKEAFQIREGSEVKNQPDKMNGKPKKIWREPDLLTPSRSFIDSLTGTLKGLTPFTTDTRHAASYKLIGVSLKILTQLHRVTSTDQVCFHCFDLKGNILHIDSLPGLAFLTVQCKPILSQSVSEIII